MRAECSALFLPWYYTTSTRFCQVFFQKKSKIFFRLRSKNVRHKCLSGKATKKPIKMGGIFYGVCFLPKKFADFRHNWIFTNCSFCGIILRADGQSPVRFPFVAHCTLFFAKCQSHGIPALRQSRCAIFICFFIFINITRENDANRRRSPAFLLSIMR